MKVVKNTELRNRRILQIAIVFMIMIAVGCFFILFRISNPSFTKTQIDSVYSSATAVKAESMNGTWKSAPGKVPQMEAVIQNESISIEMIADDTRLSYWIGTFPTPKVNGAGVTSLADDTKLFWSTGTEQAFVYRDGKITFDVSVMGITSFVTLTRG